ncbi:MAG: cupin domain-containing protein [Chitinophagaceae bacterium]
MELVAARPFKRLISTNQSYWHLESQLVTFLATAEQTAGKYAMLELTIPRGYEPPPHTHSRESESCYILDGEIEFTVGNNQFIARKGDFVYLPKYVRHSIEIVTPSASALVFIEPAGLENFYLQTSRPAPEPSLPPRPSGPIPQELVDNMQWLLKKEYGIDTR